jgi:hypothetical protein
MLFQTIKERKEKREGRKERREGEKKGRMEGKKGERKKENKTETTSLNAIDSDCTPG